MYAYVAVWQGNTSGSEHDANVILFESCLGVYALLASVSSCKTRHHCNLLKSSPGKEFNDTLRGVAVGFYCLKRRVRIFGKYFRNSVYCCVLDVFNAVTCSEIIALCSNACLYKIRWDHLWRNM